MFFVLKFELILIIGSNNVLTESARRVYRGRRVGQGWCIGSRNPKGGQGSTKDFTAIIIITIIG
jgi:hypothetical protein